MGIIPRIGMGICKLKNQIGEPKFPYLVGNVRPLMVAFQKLPGFLFCLPSLIRKFLTLNAGIGSLPRVPSFGIFGGIGMGPWSKDQGPSSSFP